MLHNFLVAFGVLCLVVLQWEFRNNIPSDYSFNNASYKNNLYSLDVDCTR